MKGGPNPNPPFPGPVGSKYPQIAPDSLYKALGLIEPCKAYMKPTWSLPGAYLEQAISALEKHGGDTTLALNSLLESM